MLSVRSWGRPGAPALVALHGFLGRSGDWSSVAAGLSGRSVLAPDLPGHAASVGLPERAYTLEGAADAVLAALDRFGIGRFDLLGYSMGGRIALHVALRAPDRCRTLIAESAHPGLARPAERAERREADEKRAQGLARDLPGFLDAWHDLPMFAGQADHSPRLRRERLRHRPPELARALRGFSTGNQSFLGERLRTAAVPRLLIVGEHDGRYRDLIGPAACVISGAGHNAHLEAPEAFLTAVNRFLNAHSPT